MKLVILALGMTAGLCAQIPEEIKASAPGGELILRHLEFKPSFFQAQVINGTGHEWDELILGVELQNTDQTLKRFSVQAAEALWKDGSISILKHFAYHEYQPDLIASIRIFVQRGAYWGMGKGRVYEGLAVQEDCIEDYLAARGLTGVALRKRLQEIVGTGCGEVIPNCPCEKLAVKTFPHGKTKVSMTHCNFQYACSLPDNTFGKQLWAPTDSLVESNDIPILQEFDSGENSASSKPSSAK